MGPNPSVGASEGSLVTKRRAGIICKPIPGSQQASLNIEKVEEEKKMVKAMASSQGIIW